jgi:cytochrome c1
MFSMIVRVSNLAALTSVLLLTLAACTAPSAPAPVAASKPASGPTPNPTAVVEGQALISQKGCGACHAIPGVPGASGTIGPSLAGVAGHTTIAGGAVPNNGPDDLKRWLLDPPALKPATAMPKLGLSDDEAAKIVAFLQTLR